ncbi:MAG: translation initiation factor IF-2, partial [Bilifractor sp.]
DRNGRPGQGQGRMSASGRPGRPGGFGAGRNEAGTGNRFGSHTGGRPGMHSDHRGGSAAMDVSVKKPTRDSRSRDKDKNKEDLRGNKFTNDSRRSGGHNNRQLIPKALQKPTHKKDEKKEEKVTEIKIGDKLTIRELAEKMKINPSVVVKDLFMKGEMYTVNQEVSYDKAEEIAMNYDISCEHEEAVDVIAEMLKEDEEDESKMVPRPPVVCVMGHVDHGKTSLLDKIRHSHVTEREAGGITQNIGAYCVSINGRSITFLDTPGHEAFTAMRMRGANSTDIAVLVVAADDGVMPQTVEAINHAKAANVEIIVAINKIDKPGANPDRVKQELTEYGLVASDWGGQTEMVEVSAKTGQGIDDLLDTILLTADILELKANPNRLARGLVLEAKLDKGKGPVANLLVQKGTLHVGDYIACGSASGKVRGMTDENGKSVRSAGPSVPVEVQGLNGVPDAGEILLATETDKEAKNIAATYVNEHKNALLEETKSRMSLDALFDQIKDGSVKELELIVKADVQGSVEALKQSLEKLSNDEVVIKIIHGGVGAINESDVSLAAASNAIVIGFNVRPDQTAKALADEEKVDIRLYRVIYQAIDDITAAMNGMLEPVYEEKVIGHAEVRQLFRASGVGNIAGSYVLDGTIQRGCKVRVYRGDDQLFEGELASLKRFKDDVKEVKAGFECGIVVEGFDSFTQGDRIEAYIMAEVPR